MANLLGTLLEMALYPPQDNVSRDDAPESGALRDPPNRLLNVQEAARFLGLSVSTLNKLRVSGNGPQYMKPVRRVLYDLGDIREWARKHRRFHTSESPVEPNSKKASC